MMQGELTFECVDCRTRLDVAPDEDRPGACPNCGGHLVNISVPRE